MMKLSEDEAAFLRGRAFALWNDHAAFTAEEVDRAKALFRRAFALEGAQPLQGFLFEDALAMTPPDNPRQYYAMVVDPGGAPLAWTSAVIPVGNFQFAPEHLCFGEFLAIVSFPPRRQQQ